MPLRAALMFQPVRTMPCKRLRQGRRKVHASILVQLHIHMPTDLTTYLAGSDLCRAARDMLVSSPTKWASIAWDMYCVCVCVCGARLP